MKSDFSRFLHHTLSHSDLIGVSRSNKFASLFNLDYRVKPDDDRKGKEHRGKPDNDNMGNVGRSMVEMLGVLAIIGVLSVGAIAGYSKTMMKYKLNQHALAVNMLINNVLQIKDQLPRTKGVDTYYANLLYKLNLLPDGIVYKNAALYDNYFKESIYIIYSDHPWSYPDGTISSDNLGIISFSFDASAQGSDICRNIAFAAKENAANIYKLQNYNSSADGTSTSNGNLRGDAYCTGNNCLRNLDLAKADALCSNCKNDWCNIRVLWK
jgi:type II secretory pathway pseudopilin PulG